MGEITLLNADGIRYDSGERKIYKKFIHKINSIVIFVMILRCGELGAAV